MKRSMFFLSLIALLLFSGALMAQPSSLREHPGKPFRKGRMARLLELSEDQQSQLLDLKLKLKREILPLQNKLKTLRTELNLEIIGDNFKESRVKRLIREMNNTRQAIQLKRILHQRDIRALLNEKQKKRFDLHILTGSKKRSKYPPRPRGPRGYQPHGGYQRDYMYNQHHSLEWR